MKLSIIILALSLSFASAKSYWEEIDLPSNRAVYDIYQDSEGKYYSAGIGFFSTNDFESWEGLNYINVEIEGKNIEASLNGFNIPFQSVMKFQDSLIIGIKDYGVSSYSTDNGNSWQLIENFENAKYITKYNDTPYIISKEGLYTYNFSEKEFVSLTASLSDVEFITGGRSDDIIYMDGISTYGIIYFYDLNEHKIKDSLYRVPMGIIGGDYFETKENAYVRSANTIKVNNKPIRKENDANFIDYDLQELFNDNFEIEEFRILETGELFINNSNGGFVIASSDFNNYSYYNSPYVPHNIVHNVKFMNGEYFLCTEFGLFRTIDKDFENTEFLSEKMGTGIYEYINRIGNDYHLINNGVITIYDGQDNKLIFDVEVEISKWNDGLWFQLNDTLYVSKDNGYTWESVYLNDTQENKKFILDNGKMAVKSGNNIKYIDYSTLQVSSKSHPGYSQNNFNFYLLSNSNTLYLFTDEGIFQSNDEGDNWSVKNDVNIFSKNQDFILDIIYFQDILVIKSVNRFSYTKDFGESLEQLDLLLPSGYGLLNTDNEIYITGFYQFENNSILKFTFDQNKELITENVSGDVRAYSPGNLGIGNDGYIYLSLKNGNYRSADPITSVEDNLQVSVDESDVEIFPNVSSDFITVNLNNTYGNPKVYHITGKTIDCPLEKLSNNSFKVDIRNLEKGMYVIVDENSENPEGSFFFRE